MKAKIINRIRCWRPDRTIYVKANLTEECWVGLLDKLLDCNYKLTHLDEGGYEKAKEGFACCHLINPKNYLRFIEDLDVYQRFLEKNDMLPVEKRDTETIKPTKDGR